MKKNIPLKLSFITLAFTLPLAVIADDSPQMGNMMRGTMMSTNSMPATTMTSNAMSGARSPMNAMAGNSMNGTSAKSMMGSKTNSMMGHPSTGNMAPNSMMIPRQPAMSSMGMTNRPQANVTNSMNMADPMGGH